MSKTTRATSRRRLTLREYFNSDVREQVAAANSKKYVRRMTRAIEQVEAWRHPVAIDDIDGNWLGDFDLHLRAAGVGQPTRRYSIALIRRIVRDRCPYRPVASRPLTWKALAPLFFGEEVGCLGNYFVNVYEAKQQWSDRGQKLIRGSVARFLMWHGGPIRLAEIDRGLLERYRRELVERGLGENHVRQSITPIRAIVNHWQPGAIPKNRYVLSDAPAGTVQHFVKSEFVRAPGRRGGRRSNSAALSKTAAVIARLTEYCKGEPLPFSKFNAELCEGFLRWCLTQGAGGKPMNANVVNSTYRFELVAISRDAAAAGILRRRLFLEPVAPLRRRPKASKNGHAASAAHSPTVEWSRPVSPKQICRLLGVDDFRTAKNLIARNAPRAEKLTSKQYRLCLADLSPSQQSQLA